MDMNSATPCFKNLYLAFKKCEISSIEAKYTAHAKSKKQVMPIKIKKKSKAAKSIMMFEPQFEKITDPLIAKQEKKSEKQKLKQKYKEEKRAAEKELKHNTAFISKQKNEKQIRLDNERKRKVNQIMSGLEQQEGDVRKIKKKSYKLFD